MSLSRPDFYVELLYGLLRPQFVQEDQLLSSYAEKDYAYSLKRFKAEGIKYLTDRKSFL
jgi:hypothetical protein